MSFAAIIAWLMANGGTIVAAGVDLTKIGTEIWKLFHGTDGTISKADFNVFVDKMLGDKAELLALIEEAKSQL